MTCPYCGTIPHSSRCPLAPEPKPIGRCFCCTKIDHDIMEWEERVELPDYGMLHLDCFDEASRVNLLTWCGGEIKEGREE